MRREIDERFSGVDLRVAADDILMRGETAAGFRREHMVGQDVVFGHRPIRLYLSRIDVLIRAFLTVHVVRVNFVPAVHFAVVVIDRERDVAVVQGIRTLKIALRQWNRRTVAHESLGDRICTRKVLEQVVDGAVLLHHDDDVLDMLSKDGVRNVRHRRRR